MKNVLWLKVTKDKYEFPLFVCDSAKELADKCGVQEQNIRNIVFRNQKGIIKKTQYRMVRIEEGVEE